MTKGLKNKANHGTLSQEDRSTEPTVSDQELRNRIAEKAYELYEKRGHIPGHDLEDWLEAQRMVLAELNPQIRDKPATPRSGRHRVKKG